MSRNLEEFSLGELRDISIKALDQARTILSDAKRFVLDGGTYSACIELAKSANFLYNRLHTDQEVRKMQGRGGQ